MTGIRERTERGVAAVEYGLIVAGCVIGCFGAFLALFTVLGIIFGHTSSVVANP